MTRTVLDCWLSHYIVNFDDNDVGFGSHARAATFEEACRLAQEHTRPNRIPKIREVHRVRWSDDGRCDRDSFQNYRPYHKELMSSWFWVEWNGRPQLITMRERYFHDKLRRTEGASREEYWDKVYWSRYENPAAIRWTAASLGGLLTELLGSRTFVAQDAFDTPGKRSVNLSRARVLPVSA